MRLSYPAGMTVSSPPDTTGELIGRNDESRASRRSSGPGPGTRRSAAHPRRTGDRKVGVARPGARPGKRFRRAHARDRRASSRSPSSRSRDCTSCLRRYVAASQGFPIRSGRRSTRRSESNDLVEPDPFRVALAAYRLISDAADSSALLLIADDAHWLDRSSLDVLTFLARRLDNEPVVFIAGLRDGFSTALEEAGLPILELDRLSASDSEKLLDRVAPGLSVDVHAAACWPRLPAIRSGSWSLRGPYRRPATPSICCRRRRRR